MGQLYPIDGTIKQIGEIQTFDSGFTKREFVLTVPDGRYPQDIKMEVVKDRCAILDRYSPGDEVRIQFALRGNEYNGRHFVNVAAIKISRGEDRDSFDQRPPAEPEDMSQDDDGEYPF